LFDGIGVAMKVLADFRPRPTIQVESNDEPQVFCRGEDVEIQARFARTRVIP
jgi:hypothetical protein